ncbi:MAG: YlbF family regulator [Verrucomicrobia bacterium]|nr:YlbF family regulator [Verrucomicrobiota bacterium]
MHSNPQNGAVLEKTLELCEAIVRQPNFPALQRDIQTFLDDDVAKQLYQTVVEKGEHLHHKQHQGISLTDEEISEYEDHRQALLRNETARRFLDAQESLRAMRETVTKYVNKTMEIGRVPTEDDFNSCGHGCSCGH